MSGLEDMPSGPMKETEKLRMQVERENSPAGMRAAKPEGRQGSPAGMRAAGRKGGGMLGALNDDDDDDDIPCRRPRSKLSTSSDSSETRSSPAGMRPGRLRDEAPDDDCDLSGLRIDGKSPPASS